jgi:hypothetical protein
MNLNSAVQLHICQHLRDFVCLHAVRDGKRWTDVRGRRLYHAFVVDPRCGLLRKNDDSGFWHRWYRAASPVSSTDVIEIDESHVARRIRDVWYELTLVPVPDTFDTLFDVAMKERVYHSQRRKLYEFHGRDVYAVAKRQLNSAEIRRLPRADCAKRSPQVLR